MASKPSPLTQYEEQTTVTLTKEDLLNSLEAVENQMKKILHVKSLGERLQELRRHVKDLLEYQEKEIKDLSKQIRKLQDDFKKEKEKTEQSEKKLSLAQATWAWEKHLARFVVDPSKEIYPSGWKDQMDDYLRETNMETSRLDRIRNTDKKEKKQEEKRKEKTCKWNKWRVIKNIRRERNSLARPSLFNLKFVELEISKMSSNQQLFLRDMMDELKMTASLMKFGRLAKDMSSTENALSKKWNECAMNDIISWDRKFEEIDGLQNIDHNTAKEYLEKYVNNPGMIQHYFYIVDSIKQANGERLGKMARQIKLPEDSKDYDKALSCLKELSPPHHERKSPRDRLTLNATIAKLHVPDFLKMDLWEDGIKLVEIYVDQTSNPRFNKK